jgi:hypothetical protein
MRKWVFHHLLLWDILSVYVLVSGMLTFRSSFDTVQFDLPFRIEWTGLTPNGPVSLKLVKLSNELELDITSEYSHTLFNTLLYLLLPSRPI